MNLDRTWLKVLLTVLPPATLILAGLQHGRHFIDDAYITFRYAENLSLGHGLVFNPDESVLGTTTPLFALVLAALKVAGVSIIPAAQWLGLLSMAGVTLILQSLLRQSTTQPVAFAMGMCIALHPDTAFMASSGMETAPSLLLVLGSLLFALNGRPGVAGACGGAAMLMRPDGVLVVALTSIVLAYRNPGKLWRLLLAATLVVAPWILYATFTYGSPVPHSIPAKKLVHAATFSQIALAHVQSLTLNLPLKFLAGLGIIGGLLSLLRRSELSLVTLWVAAYSVSLGASGIAPQFPWYVTPLSPVLVLLAAYALDQIAVWISKRQKESSDVRSWPRRFFAPGVLLLLAGLCITDVNWRGFRTDTEEREAAYFTIGNYLQTRSRAGDVVFVGEVGVLSYVLLEQKIIDSSGINSPDVLRFRREEWEELRKSTHQPSPEGTWRWVTRVIEDARPDYVVTKYPWLHIGKVEELPWFGERYRRIMLENKDLRDYRVFEKR